jgi:hypothetical protein
MTGSDKAYSAPRLETLGLRETRAEIDITVILDLGGLIS